jgi:hypothetical protein
MGCFGYVRINTVHTGDDDDEEDDDDDDDDETNNSCSQRKSIKRFKEKCGNHTRERVDSLQKTAILGTSHVIRKVLDSETLRLSGGDHRRFKMRSTMDKRPVARE